MAIQLGDIDWPVYSAMGTVRGMTEAELAIHDRAIKFAKANGKAIARRIADPEIFLGEDNPVSVFMAGSPGAGKTEASIELLATLDGPDRILRIDPDELRSEFSDYDGANAWLFQGAASLLVEKIHDLALGQKQTFLLDGTLSRFKVAETNVDRSLRKGRLVQILYVYQQPQSAWKFVKAREIAEGRRIRPETFVEQFFAAQEVVQQLKVKFKQDIKIDVLLKNIDGSHRQYHANVDQIESFIPEKFTRQQVINLAV